MATITLTPLTALTDADIKKITIHSTRGSLRRSAGENEMVTVQATSTMPTLYYIFRTITGGTEWEIHALASELTQYLLLKSVG
jgi:hypothetical protein